MPAWPYVRQKGNSSWAASSPRNLVLYHYSLFLKQSMTKNHCKTKEVFIIALKDFGDPVHRAWLSHRHSSAVARRGR